VTPITDAHADIERLLSSYALLLDARDIDALTDLFVPDGELALRGGKTYAGHAALHRFFSRSTRGIHLPGPTLIDVANDGASATVWQSWLFVADGTNSIKRGMYRDVLEHDRSRWRFRRRELDLHPEGPDPEDAHARRSV
jgi:ketosteroid isomerase-like protein